MLDPHDLSTIVPWVLRVRNIYVFFAMELRLATKIISELARDSGMQFHQSKSEITHAEGEHSRDRPK
jgi:hypothetical protein